MKDCISNSEKEQLTGKEKSGRTTFIFWEICTHKEKKGEYLRLDMEAEVEQSASGQWNNTIGYWTARKSINTAYISMGMGLTDNMERNKQVTK